MRAAADAFKRPVEGSEVKKWEVVRAQTSPLSFFSFFSFKSSFASALKPNVVFLEAECPWTVVWGAWTSTSRKDNFMFSIKSLER